MQPLVWQITYLFAMQVLYTLRRLHVGQLVDGLLNSIALWHCSQGDTFSK
jgi:hypothetical protein